jgi:hypothetical protein
MNDIYTFTTHDNKFQFSVKFSFYSKFFANTSLKPEQEQLYVLMNKYGMASYLHNSHGPAIIYKETGKMEYFINGKQLSEKDGQRLQHEVDFNNNIAEILND